MHIQLCMFVGELKGVMRVGSFAHDLLLKGECSAELVLLCEAKPTITLFNIILGRLASRFEVHVHVCIYVCTRMYNTTIVSTVAVYCM